MNDFKYPFKTLVLCSTLFSTVSSAETTAGKDFVQSVSTPSVVASVNTNQQWKLYGSHVTPNGNYFISSMYSHKCMDATNRQWANGTPVQQWDCQADFTRTTLINGTNWNQRWTFRENGTSPNGSKLYRITVGDNDGVCLDVENNSIWDGAKIQLQQCDNSSGQNWKIAFVSLPNSGSLVVSIINFNSGKCLDVTDWSTSNGRQLQQWTCQK